MFDFVGAPSRPKSVASNTAGERRCANTPQHPRFLGITETSLSRSLGSPCLAWHCLRLHVSLLLQLSRRALPVQHVPAQASGILPPPTAACGPVAGGVPMKGSGCPVAALFPGLSWPWHCFRQSQCPDFREPCSQVIVLHCFQCLCSQLGPLTSQCRSVDHYPRRWGSPGPTRMV